MNIDATTESLLQCVLDISQNGILVYQAIRSEQGAITDLRLRMFNAAFERDTRRSAAELIGHSFKQDAHFLTAIGVFDRYCRVLEEGKPDRFEISFTHPGQTNLVWHDVSVIPKEDLLVISYTDITEVRKQKEALLEAEVLQNSFNTSINGVTVFEAMRNESGQITELRFLMINETGLRMEGMSREEVICRTIREIYPQPENEGMFGLFVQVCETGQPYSGEHFYPTYNVWREMNIVPVKGGVMAIYNDITERKRIERIKQQQSELLWAIVDNTQIGLSLFEPVWNEGSSKVTDFTYTFTNPANAFQTKRSVEEMTGQSVLSLFPDLEQTEFYRHLVDVFQTGQPKRFLFSYVIDHVKGWFDCILVRLGNGVLLSSLDVSESYQHQQQLELVNRELLHSNDNLQQFAYAASHDLQEPLRKIKAFGDLLVHQFSDVLNPNAVDIIRRMQSASERMSILIRDLLAYSRISTHRESFQSVILSDVLKLVIDDLKLTIQQAKADIQVNKLPIVHGDASQLRQLFQNLLTNALKFQRAEVPPSISVDYRLVVGAELDREPLSNIIIESKFSDDRRRAYYEITITDNGIGFDQQYSERIFQVFQRLHNRSLYEGSGVGLAICKKVVDNHQGAITATGQLGIGAIFTVYLPVHRNNDQ